MIAISARLEVERLDAAGLDERDEPERLDRRAQGDEPVGVAELADDPAGGVGLDDVAAVDALLDAVAELADEDRRRPSRPRAAERGSARGRWRATAGAGTDPRIPRRLLR